MSFKIYFSLLFLVLVLSSCAMKPEETPTPEPEIDLAHISIPLEGVYNFRDMGGYPTTNGRKVKYGLVYRSDDLNALTENDKRTLEGLKIKSIVDFRSKAEIKKAPDKKLKTVKNVYDLSIEPGNLSTISFESLTKEEAEQMMIDINKYFVVNAQEQYRTFFEIMSDKNDLPVLFHCTAGKDRTGFAGALFLSALGVDRETIYNEYLLSAQYIKHKYKDSAKEMPNLAALYTVRRAYLEAAFNEIEKKYGSVDDYLIKHLYVDLKLLRSIYTTR